MLREMNCAQVFEVNLQQCIQTIQGGVITGGNHEEYIVQTFGGAIMRLSNGDVLNVTMPAEAGSEEKIAAAKKEAAQLELRQLEDSIRQLMSESEVRRCSGGGYICRRLPISIVNVHSSDGRASVQCILAKLGSSWSRVFRPL
jgi:hypothetical protein